MAVFRGFASCASCGKEYILRIGVGVEKNYIHTFDCVDCHLPISINLFSMGPGSTRVQAEENCSVSHQEGENPIVINLHPSFAFELNSLHNPKHFASFDYMWKIVPHIQHLPGNYRDLSTEFELPNCQNIWPVVKNIIFTNSPVGKKEIIQKQIKQYETMRRKYNTDFSANTVKAVIDSFFHDMFYPKIEWLLSPILALLSELKTKYSSEYERFIAYYKSNLQQENQHRYVSVFSDYFRYYEQFRQMLTHARIDDSDVSQKIVGSKRFEEIKLFYGQAYETITTNYTILACLNNINEGRSFDEFKSMTLNKYQKDVEKAKRSNPFKDNTVLYAFCAYEDSSLRNGSHHASIWRNGEMIHFRSGGSGAERNMPYSQYIHICNGITISLAALFMVELNML